MSAPLVACVCGASLDDAPGAIWTLDNTVAEYRHCRACGSSRFYAIDREPGRRVCLYADPETSEIWIDPTFGVCEWDALHEAFDVAPPTAASVLVRNGVTLARARELRGILVWVVERPRRV